MNYKFIIIFFLFLSSCSTNSINEVNKKNIIQSEVFSNRGFTLLYDEDLKKKKLVTKKIDERSLIIFQKNIKKNTNVKVTNLLNNKSILAKVGSKSNYPDFFNSVVSKRIFTELDLDELEPYVEIKTITEKSTFFAKKAKMYEEEKQVAEKAPVEGISINDLSLNKIKKKKKQKKDKFNYIIKIADFYYENTAITMQNRIYEELNIKKPKISKISNTSYRVYYGPFDNIKSLKKVFDDITPLNFENIEILKL